MKRATKQKIRSILTIMALSDGKKITTQQLLKKLQNPKKWIGRYNRFLVWRNEETPINDQTLSRVLNDLKNRNIIKRQTGPRNKQGAKPNLCSLINTPETFFRIYQLFHESGYPSQSINWFVYELHKSEYGQFLIYPGLVENLNDDSRITYQWPINFDTIAKNKQIKNCVLSDEELELILKIIRISPSAFVNVLNLLFNKPYYDSFYSFPGTTASHIIVDVIFGLLIDLRMNIPLRYPVDYKINIQIQNEPIKDKERIVLDLNTNFEGNKIEHYGKSKIINLDGNQGEYDKAFKHQMDRRTSKK